MLLAGDIGGTKTVMGLFEPTNQSVRLLRDATFSSRDYGSFDAVVSAFLEKESAPALGAACFAVAGPVVDGRCQTTNLPWTLEEAALARVIGVPRVKLLNDVEAAAYGMLFLPPDDYKVLNPGTDSGRKGNIAVVSVGTGLGEGILYWDGTHHHPVASEGGHADFAPRTDQEIALLQYLARQHGGHVSYERVLSGPGLSNVYAFLRDSGYAPETDWVAQQLQSSDPNAAITRIGLAGQDRLCTATLEVFASVLGAEAGNLALKCVALGGVFIAGGIAPKILPVLQLGGCVRAFTNKGRLSDLLQSIPVRVALNLQAPLLGAAHYALRL